MRGEVLHYDDGAGNGLISGDDGVRYSFKRADLQQLRPLARGMKVDFVPVNGVATEVFVVDAAAAPQPAYAQHGYQPQPGYAAGPLESTNEDLGLWQYFMKCMRLSFNGEGRARRKEYWSFVLFNVLIFMGLYFMLLFTVGASMTASYNSYSSYGGYGYDVNPVGALFATGWGIAIVIFALVFLPASITVLIRRLHDIGLTGWWILAGFVPFLGGLFLFICTLIPSERRVNKHGLYPKPVTPY